MYRDWATYAAGEGFGDGYLRMSGVFFQSGGNPDLAALLAAEVPYTGWASYYYDGYAEGLAREAFRHAAALAAKYGLRVHTTSGGGAGLDNTLSVFEEVAEDYPLAERRWVIEHLSTPTPANIEQMARLGVVSTAIPYSIWDATPPESLENFRPYKSVLEAGIRLNLSTDNVPPNPFFAIWAAVTRENMHAGGPLGPGTERLSREEALRAMTINGAYLSFEEDVKGSIEVGKYADLIVLDRDYLEIVEEEIKDIEVLLTMVGGSIVYETEWRTP
jgi:predicted amidohydrolase YtcJ